MEKLIADECTFSITLSDRNALEELSIITDSREQVSLWGSIGDVIEVNFVEGLVLQIKGSRGVMEIGVTQEKLAESVFHEEG